MRTGAHTWATVPALQGPGPSKVAALLPIYSLGGDRGVRGQGIRGDEEGAPCVPPGALPHTQALGFLEGPAHGVTGGAIAMAHAAPVLHGTGVDLEVAADALQHTGRGPGASTATSPQALPSAGPSSPRPQVNHWPLWALYGRLQ